MRFLRAFLTLMLLVAVAAMPGLRHIAAVAQPMAAAGASHCPDGACDCDNSGDAPACAPAMACPFNGCGLPAVLALAGRAPPRAVVAAPRPTKILASRTLAPDTRPPLLA